MPVVSSLIQHTHARTHAHAHTRARARARTRTRAHTRTHTYTHTHTGVFEKKVIYMNTLLLQCSHVMYTVLVDDYQPKKFLIMNYTSNACTHYFVNVLEVIYDKQNCNSCLWVYVQYVRKQLLKGGHRLCLCLSQTEHYC